MMVVNRPRRCREVTGPMPHSVAIIARGPKKSAIEDAILEARRKEAERKVQDKELGEVASLHYRNQWTNKTGNKLQINVVKRRVQQDLKAHEYNLNDRRESLKTLLQSEEERYLQEMDGTEETLLERQAKMREKARTLKETREIERQQVVEDKLAQQWRNQCEELRSTLSKRNQDQVAAERMDQLWQKEQVAKKREEEERMYADLWYADMMAKAQREEEDTKRQMSANKGMLEVLHRQVAALDAQKENEKALIAEEADILREQKELRRLEDIAALEDKRRKQRDVRVMYDKSMKLKKDKEARQLQEQMAFDMKILEQLLEESRNEAMELQQRKREYREEDRRYRSYLEQLKREEELRQLELDRMCDAEVEKMWEKKVKQWKIEKEARRKLLQDVMASRRIQLQDKLVKNDERQRDAAQERQELLLKLEDNKRIEEQENARSKGVALKYQNDLVGQMCYNQRLKDDDKDDAELIWRSQQDAEIEYRKKLELELRNPDLTKLHPIRKRSSHLPSGLIVSGSAVRGGGMN